MTQTLIQLHKWTEIILSLDNPSHANLISKKTNITWSHAQKIIKELVGVGLISKDTSGRIHQLTLTIKGREVYNHLIELKKLIQ